MSSLKNKIRKTNETIHISVLVEDTARKKGLCAEHGLSLLVEWETNKVLFDTGQTGLFIKNAQTIGKLKDLEQVSSVVLSHGHYDHTGGLCSLLGHLNHRPDVYCHPRATEPKYATKPGIQRENPARYIGAPPEVKDSNLTCVSAPMITKEEFIVTGTIPRKPGYKTHGTGVTKDSDGAIVADSVEDSMAMIVPTVAGNVVITGCAHAGLENILSFARNITGDERILALVGGFHLLNATSTEIQETLNFLQSNPPDILAPCHCTGLRAQAEVLQRFSYSTRILSSGDVLSIPVREKLQSPKEKKANHPVIVLFHGSRNQQVISEAHRVVKEMANREPERTIEIAFISSGEPSLTATLHKITQHSLQKVTIVPAFMFKGVHLEKDLKKAIEPLARLLGPANIYISSPVGEGSDLSNILLSRLRNVENED